MPYVKKKPKKQKKKVPKTAPTKTVKIHYIDGDIGAGKTEKYLKIGSKIIKKAIRNKEDYKLTITGDNHDFLEEGGDRLLGFGVKSKQIYGLAQPNMCLHPERVEFYKKTKRVDLTCGGCSYLYYPLCKNFNSCTEPKKDKDKCKYSKDRANCDKFEKIEADCNYNLQRGLKGVMCILIPTASLNNKNVTNFDANWTILDDFNDTAYIDYGTKKKAIYDYNHLQHCNGVTDVKNLFEDTLSNVEDNIEKNREAITQINDMYLKRNKPKDNNLLAKKVNLDKCNFLDWREFNTRYPNLEYFAEPILFNIFSIPNEDKKKVSIVGKESNNKKTVYYYVSKRYKNEIGIEVKFVKTTVDYPDDKTRGEIDHLFHTEYPDAHYGKSYFENQRGYNTIKGRLTPYLEARTEELHKKLEKEGKSKRDLRIGVVTFAKFCTKIENRKRVPDAKLLRDTFFPKTYNPDNLHPLWNFNLRGKNDFKNKKLDLEIVIGTPNMKFEDVALDGYKLFAKNYPLIFDKLKKQGYVIKNKKGHLQFCEKKAPELEALRKMHSDDEMAQAIGRGAGREIKTAVIGLIPEDTRKTHIINQIPYEPFNISDSNRETLNINILKALNGEKMERMELHEVLHKLGETTINPTIFCKHLHNIAVNLKSIKLVQIQPNPHIENQSKSIKGDDNKNKAQTVNKSKGRGRPRRAKFWVIPL